jgi:hypothetical protein
MLDLFKQSPFCFIGVVAMSEGQQYMLYHRNCKIRYLGVKCLRLTFTKSQ